jgi:uncharacterized protein with HEPN domain
VSRSDHQRIADILDAASELENITARGHREFVDDPVLQRAAERLLEIIGEAANMLDDQTTAHHPDVPWRDITRLRILLAHHYHRVDPGQVWVVAAEHVPKLRSSLGGEGS